VNSETLKRLAPIAGSRLLVVGGCGGIGKCLVKAALDKGIEVMVFDLESSLETTELPAAVHSFGNASIVNMSSGLADVCNPGYGPYSTAKAAIEQQPGR